MDNTIDIRDLLNSVGSSSFERALLAPVVKRTKPDFPSILLENNSKKVEVEPLAVSGFMDGIQASLCLKYISHRPVYLSYACAGVISGDKNLDSVKESLELVISQEELDWYEGLNFSMKKYVVPSNDPEVIEHLAATRLSETRNELELASIAGNLESVSGYLVVDGGLVGKNPNSRLVGVVKTTRNKYLEDETLIKNLPEGFMSQRFIIPAGSQGVLEDRYSCYLRLHDASRRHWNFGLVRLESFDPEILESLASRCLLERQSQGSIDPRFDRHITSIKTCEDKLRANRPSIFQL